MANDVKIVLTAQDKASEGVNRVAGRLEALEKASSAVAARMDTIRNALAGVVTVGAGLAVSKQFIDMADSMALLQSRVKLATSGAAEFAQVQADLFALAQRNSVSLEEVSGAFSRLSDPVKRLGGSSKEAIGIIDALSKSLKISGASSQESAAAIAQFGQAMGSGKLQGDEFKSLAEAAPRFMKAISEGSGIAAEKLKDMASEGKLTADVVGNALLKSLGKLNAEAAQMPDTVGQAMTRLKNEVAKAVDEINQAGGINTALAGMVGDTAALIAPIKQEMIEAFQAVGEWIDRNRSDLDGLFGTIQALAGDVWRMAGYVWDMAEAFAGVVGWIFEALGGLGTVKTALESARLLVAGIEDGFTAIGAALVKVGAWLIDRLAEPLADIMESYGKFLETIGSSSADWFQQTGRSIRATTESAHQYSATVYKAFADGETAVGRLNAELAAAEKSQAAVASAAKKTGEALTGQAKAAASVAAGFDPLKNKNPSPNTDKKPTGADPYQQLLDSLRKRIHATENLNELEKLNIELQEKKYARLAPLQKANLQALAMQIDASRLAARYAKQDAEDEAKRVSAAQRSGQAMADETDAIWDKVEAEVEAAAAIGKSRTEIEARTLALMEEQLAWREALDLQDEETAQLKRKIAAQKAMIAAVRNTESTQAAADAGKAAVEAAKQAAEAAAAEWQKTVDRIDQTFHDGFVGMLEKGKADWESFADSIANTFKTAVADEIYKLTLRPMVLQIATAFTGGQPGAVGQAQGFGGVLSNLQSAYAGVTGGISNAANSFAMSGMGQWAGLSGPVAMGPPTAAGQYGVATGLTGAGSSFVAAAAPVAAAAASAAVIDGLQRAGWGPDNNLRGYLSGMAPGMVMSGSGLSNGLTSGLSGVNAALFSASAVGTLGASIVADRLFGRNRNISNDAAGIRGTFDLTGFSGEQFQERSQKGGTFRGDKRWTEASAIASDMDAALDSMLRQTVSGLQAIGKTLNVEAVQALEGFSHEFQLQLTENGDWSKASEKIAAEVAKVSDDLVTRLVPNIADLSRYGESASQAFERLNQEVVATDAILLAMGKSAAEAFGGVGLASIAAREHLIDLAGGLDKLASKTQSFYANFYTSEEQMALAAKQAQKVLDQGFADLSLTLPTDRKGFRDLVEFYGADLSTEGNRKLFNALLDLQDEFDAVADAAEAAGTGSKKIAEVAKQASEQATGQLASIFDTFASDTQKLDAAKKLVSDTFASIGEKVPSSAAEFLALAQSIDPATEAGQGFVAALAKVSNAFAYTQTAAANAAAAAISSANAAASAYFAGVDAAKRASTLTGEGMSAIDVLFGNINDQAKTAAESAASAASDTANAWRSASQSIKSALDNIRTGALSSLSPEARYRLLQSQFATTSASAASGNVDAVGKLGQIATDFLEASRDYNASSEAFQADRAAADAELSKSLSYASAQVSTQEAIASASRAAVDQLQSLNSNLSDFGKQALELLQKGYAGIDRQGATVAVGKLAEMQTAFDRWFGNTQAGEVTRDKQVFGDAYWTRLAGDMASFTGSDGAVSYIRASESLLDIAKRIPELRADWEKQFGISLPSYAVGTPFVPEDQIAQIHQGEMIIPASAAAQLRKYGIGSQPDNGLQAEILAELRSTRQGQQQSYSAMQQQLASSNAKLAAVERRLAAMEDQARLQRAGS